MRCVTHLGLLGALPGQSDEVKSGPGGQYERTSHMPNDGFVSLLFPCIGPGSDADSLMNVSVLLKVIK